MTDTPNQPADWPIPTTAEDIESEARELHKKSCVGWMRWNQLSQACQEEFRQNARKKLGTRDAKTNA